ncbi:cytochrome C oxidase subunit IV family protein [Marivirga sp. S37H4]|uniref:Cytochrome C oxidase subunit IV family protein n=1 Tax=Marivirga aurantiaca TaxID=2802615 RepID=A0A934WVV6_9BACT|nr:cytochrome C oxidase subunit IV family protein [Marivirga aurantiaca]MBK6264008.1 cytochrome C oxidase subunit IV family protein [Marivirga aurantiaca]
MKRLILVYLGLIILTIVSAYASGMEMDQVWIPAGIVMALAAFKFILVVMEYMEMRKAHGIWKFSIVFMAVIAALIVGIFGGVQI